MKSNFKRDPKSFYRFLNSKRRCTGYPSVMKYEDSESGDDSVVSNMFANFFSKTYSNEQYDDSKCYPYDISTNNSIAFPTINACDVFQKLQKLKTSFSYGPDRVPSCILKCCASSFVNPLTRLFNSSIEYGYFPILWRDSFVIPLFKSGSKSSVSNYRCIAKLSAIPKIFEQFITDILIHHTSSLLTPMQHGFRKGCSTVTNVLHFTTLINRGFREGKQTDAVYTDFSKAFDKVNHQLLLLKLDLIGLTPSSLNWIKSYLTDRKQTVCYKNVYSKNFNCTSGVPQGSHLGPILFALFINDLPKVIKYCNILMYADDVKIFYNFKHYMEHSYLQSDLNNFFLWCTHNLMELNLKKCKCMRFSRSNFIAANYFIGGYQLELVDNFLDLGILLDPKLTFVPHITMTVNKARGTLSFIKRWAKEFTDPYITKHLFTSLVRPILEYGAIIWDPFYMVYEKMVESVQKQFLIFCLRGLNWNANLNLPSYTHRLALIKLPTLKSRRTMLKISFIVNLIKGDVCSEFLLNNISFNIPQRSLRSFLPLHIKICRSNYALADPLRRICMDFNKYFNFIDFSLNPNVIKNL